MSIKKHLWRKINETKAFLLRLRKKIVADELIPLSYELAHRVLMAFFPFIVFVVTLVGFLNIDSNAVTHLFSYLPYDIASVIQSFLNGLSANPSAGLLTASIFVSIFSASGGFRSVIRGVNKAYDVKDERNIFIKILLSLALMLIFAFSLILMMVIWLFNNEITSVLQNYFSTRLNMLWQLGLSLVSLVVLTGATALIFYLAKARRDKGKILPGACVTVILWLVFSQLFGLFITHFSNISALYGSIAGVFTLLLWINFICLFLLLGSAINSTLK